MYDIYSLTALWLCVIFALIGAVQLIGPRFVREAYRRWDYGRRVRLVTGALDIVAAILIGSPALRAWGIALAAILTFGSVIVFLNHRQYRQAVPAIGLLLALIPATVAVPRPAQVQFVDGRGLQTAQQQRMADETRSRAPVEQVAERTF